MEEEEAERAGAAEERAEEEVVADGVEMGTCIAVCVFVLLCVCVRVRECSCVVRLLTDRWDACCCGFALCVLLVCTPFHSCACVCVC